MPRPGQAGYLALALTATVRVIRNDLPQDFRHPSSINRKRIVPFDKAARTCTQPLRECRITRQ